MHEQLNYTLSAEERAELDALGVEGVWRQFREEGLAQRREAWAKAELDKQYRCIMHVTYKDDYWYGCVRVSTPELRALLPPSLSTLGQLLTTRLPSDEAAAKAVDRCVKGVHTRVGSLDWLSRTQCVVLYVRAQAGRYETGHRCT